MERQGNYSAKDARFLDKQDSEPQVSIETDDNTE